MQAMNPRTLFRLQIFVGVALGPSLFGRLAPSYFQLFAGPSTLKRLPALASWRSSSADSLLDGTWAPAPSAAIESFGVDHAISLY
jgi:hypothetical protein